MANDVVKGTFSGAGTSAAISGRAVDISMDFAGTASVDIEQQMPSGAWIKIETAIAADYSMTAEFATVQTIRLNCTAFTDAVEYALESGSEG